MTFPPLGLILICKAHRYTPESLIDIENFYRVLLSDTESFHGVLLKTLGMCIFIQNNARSKGKRFLLPFLHFFFLVEQNSARIVLQVKLDQKRKKKKELRETN